MKKLVLVVVAVLTVALAAAAWAGDVSFPKDVAAKYKHIGSLVIPDKSSPLFGIHHFYMNPKGLDAFKKGQPYPEGTIIVGKIFEVVTKDGLMNEGKKLFKTYMKKDASAKDTGGWIFAAFSPDGKKLDKDVKADCFNCHASVKDSDYVFSKPLK